MSELLDKLAERERARLQAENEAAVRVREAMTKVTKASEELMELRRLHEHEIKVLRVQHEKRLRDQGYACRQKVHKARQEQTHAEGVAEATEKKQRGAEAHVHVLQLKLKELQSHLDRHESNSERKLAGMKRLMNARVESMTAHNDGRIQSMVDHSSEVINAAATAVDNISDELHGQVARTHVRAEGRSRFRELCDLAKSHCSYHMSNEAYFGAKNDLIDLWHQQKASVPTEKQEFKEFKELTMTARSWAESYSETAPPPLSQTEPRTPRTARPILSTPTNTENSLLRLVGQASVQNKQASA